MGSNCQKREKMRHKLNFVLLLFAFSLLAGGCSQVVSNPYEEEELSDDIVVDDEENSSSSKKTSKSSSSAKSSSSGKSSSSAKSSSSGKSSSSATSSSAANSSTSAKSSSSATSSSSVNSSSSETSSSSMASSSSSAESSSSSNKVQPRLAEYPYYDYVAVPWSFGPRNSTPPYYDASLFDSVEYTWINADEFDDSDWEWREDLYTSINVVEEKAASVAFLFYPTGAKHYMLSFEPREGYTMPYLRVMVNGQDQYPVTKGVGKNGRWYYPMDAEALHFAKEPVKLVLTYGMKSRIYDQRWSNFILSDDGTGYPQEFDINLIVAGKYMGTSDSVSVDVLAQRILDRMNLALNPAGIKVRKVSVLYAQDHPSVGARFPESEIVIHDAEKENRHVSIDSLSKWPGHEGEISFVLGYYISYYGSSVTGLSPMPGHISYLTQHVGCAERVYLMDKTRDCPTQISLATHSKDGERNFSSREITSAALHEFGHFVGLKHTSEWGVVGASPYDDIEDTPECADAFPGVKDCGDYGYIMYPYNSMAYENVTFTPQQMEVIRTYLSSNPH